VYYYFVRISRKKQRKVITNNFTLPNFSSKKAKIPLSDALHGVFVTSVTKTKAGRIAPAR
jgi:hypothetical protein